MKVSVAVALHGRQMVLDLDLPAGSTVADALASARIEERFPELAARHRVTGIWSKLCAPGTVLREGDRVEVYRALQADAKQMRRTRATASASAKPLKRGPRSRSEP